MGTVKWTKPTDSRFPGWLSRMRIFVVSALRLSLIAQKAIIQVKAILVNMVKEDQLSGVDTGAVAHYIQAVCGVGQVWPLPPTSIVHIAALYGFLVVRASKALTAEALILRARQFAASKVREKTKAL